MKSMEPITISRDGYLVTNDRRLMRPDDVHRWLSECSYWNKGLPKNVFDKAFDNSHSVGILYDGEQIGYGRLITDYAIFGYLADVFVTEPHRGKGLAKAMMQLLLEQEWVKQLRVLRLLTTDAHGLYRPFGFTESSNPERMMELVRS